MQKQYVYGVVPFSNRQERRDRYHELKAEYGNRVKIKVENGLLVYKFTELVS